MRIAIAIFGLLTITGQLWLGQESAGSVRAGDDITRLVVIEEDRDSHDGNSSAPNTFDAGF